MTTPGPNTTAGNHEVNEMSYDKMVTLCTMKLLHLVRSGIRCCVTDIQTLN